MNHASAVREPDRFRLHRIHAAPASGVGGNSFDLGPFRWRPEGPGGQHELARAIAYRVAFTWNAAEGIPLQALEEAVLAEFHAAAVALSKGLLSGEVCGRTLLESAGRLLELDRRIDFDRTDGRLHDCHQCLPQLTPLFPTADPE